MPLIPVPGNTVKCGLRTDLPKKMRRHAWIPLGEDVRNFGEAGFQDCLVFACIRCGTDRKVSIDEIARILARAGWNPDEEKQ